MEDTLLKLRILVSAEKKLARITLQRLANRAVFFAIAVGLILLAFVLTNIGAYHLLIVHYGPSDSAFLLAAGNTVLAVVLAIFAWRMQAGPEEKLAREIREMALDELTADVEDLKDQFDKVGSDVKRIRTGFSVLSKGGSIGAGLASIAPVISVVADTIKEHRKQKKEKKAQEARKEEDVPTDE